MTSMLLTESRGFGGPPGPPPLSLFGAVTQADSLLLRVRGRRVFDHRTDDRLVRLDPVGDQLPLLAVPLLELDRSTAFVVRAGNLDRLQEVVGAELLQALLVQVQVLQAPAHLLARQRLLSKLRLRCADRLGV